MEYLPFVTVVLAAIAYIIGKKESHDSREFHDIKQLLANIAANSIQQTKQSAPPASSSTSTSASASPHLHDDEEDDAAEMHRKLTKKLKKDNIPASPTPSQYSQQSQLVGNGTTAAASGGNGIGRNQSSDSIANDIDLMRQSLKKLERKNQLLARQLALAETSNVVEIDSKYAGGLSAAEIETIRAVFNLFDVRHNGTIHTSELQSLHQKLGEPLTDDEAEESMEELDPSQQGEVTFNKFVYWWYSTHKGGKKSTQYTNRFKLLNAKLADSSFSVDKVVVQDR
jgi:hypothetical protein